MTRTEAEALVKKHGSETKAAAAICMSRTSFRRRLAGEVAGAAVKAVADAPKPQESAAGAFSLRGVTLLNYRPQDTIKKRLYGLRRGMGYEVAELAREWRMTPETLRKHAREHKALAYVERTPGDYVACVVHPEQMKEDGNE
jgi:hypothetical protein